MLYPFILKKYHLGRPELLVTIGLAATFVAMVWIIASTVSLERQLVSRQKAASVHSALEHTASNPGHSGNTVVMKRIRGILVSSAFLIGTLSALSAGLLWYTLRMRARFTRAAAIRRESVERYRFLAEGPPSIGIIRFSLTDFRLTDANRAALKITGRPRSEFVGRPIREFICPEDMGLMLQTLEQLRGGKRGAEIVVKMENTLGEEKDVAWHISRTTNPHNEPSAIAICTDVTERRRAEAERLEKERLAGVLEMAGAAAHELNQPLQVVTGLAWMILERTNPQSPQYELAQKLQMEVERMIKIGQKISQISSYKVKKYVGKTRIIDIDKAALSNGKFWRGNSKKKNRPK